MKVVGWGAWYADGSTFSSETLARFEDLPALGLQIVMLYFDTFDPPTKIQYRRILEGADFYFLTDPAKTEDGSGFGQAEGLQPPPDAKVDSVKIGTQLSDAAFAVLEATVFATRTVEDVGKIQLPPPPDPTPVPTVKPGIIATALAWVKGLFQ